MTESAYASLDETLRQTLVTLGWTSLRPVQELSIPAIRSGSNVVVVAPTAGGKTEAALLPLVDRVLKDRLPPVSVLYVCPLRALLNNIEPRVRAVCEPVGLSAFKWHGEVDASKKRAFREEPADILLTTPESLEAMLMSRRTDANQLFINLRTVVVDEIHSFAGDDRGAHLLSVIERIQRYAPNDLQRVGLSATVGNPDLLTRWITGGSSRTPKVVNPPRERSPKTIRVATATPEGDFEASAAAEAQGKKVLVFVPSRAIAESTGAALLEKTPNVFVHHSSVARSVREEAEQVFSESESAIIVCTTTLELGIDIGDLDLVQQLDAPNTVSSFLQRLGRTGRRGPPQRMSFYTSGGSSLLRATALVRLARENWVEPIEPSRRSFHVLVHQILTSVIEQPGVLATDLWQRLRNAWPFGDVADAEFHALVKHLVSLSVLDATGGAIQLGPEGERQFGRKNYFDLFAIFEGAREFSVRTEHGDEVGTLQTSYVLLTHEQGDFVFLLAGRCWEAVSVNAEAGLITARPAPRGKIPRWSSAYTGYLSRRVSEEQRSILANADVEPFLNDPAKAELQRLRDEFGAIARTPGWVVVPGQHQVNVFTFVGMRINLTIAQALRRSSWSVSAAENDHFTIGGSDATPDALIAELKRLGAEGFDLPLRQSILGSLPRRRLSKFQALLPTAMEEEYIAQQLLDFDGAQAALREAEFRTLEA